MRCIVCDAEKANYRCRVCRSAYCSSTCYKKHRITKEEAVASNAGPNAESCDYLCETIVAAQHPVEEQDAKRQRTEAMADVFSDVSREKALSAAMSSPTTTTRSPLAEPENGSSSSDNNDNSHTCDNRSTHAAAPFDSAADSQPHDAAGHRGDVEVRTDTARTTTTTTILAAPAANGGEETGEVAADADAVYILQEKHLSALANDPGMRRALRSPTLQKLILTIDSSRSRLDALHAAQYNNADFNQFCNEVMRIIARAEGR